MEIVDEDTKIIDFSGRYHAVSSATTLLYFRWSCTDEGFDYWLDVRKRLMRIVRDGR